VSNGGFGEGRGEPSATVHGRVGEVEGVLEERSGTGYHWAVSGCPSAVFPLGDSLLPPASSSPGALSRRRFRFKVIAPGVHEVQFELKRGWEAMPARRCTAQLVIE